VSIRSSFTVIVGCVNEPLAFDCRSCKIVRLVALSTCYTGLLMGGCVVCELVCAGCGVLRLVN